MVPKSDIAHILAVNSKKEEPQARFRYNWIRKNQKTEKDKLMAQVNLTWKWLCRVFRQTRSENYRNIMQSRIFQLYGLIAVSGNQCGGGKLSKTPVGSALYVFDR